MNRKRSKTKGVSFISLLTAIFIVLKLLHAISWPWIWVFSPIWISGLAAVLMFGTVLVVGKIKKGKW